MAAQSRDTINPKPFIVNIYGGIRLIVAVCTQKKVFVIEPDVAIRDGLTALLNTHKIPVQGYSDAEIFLDFVCHRRPVCSCLLLEAELPGLSSFELLRRLHSCGICIPAIVLVSTSNAWLAEQALKAGAREVIKKPLLNEGLLDSVLRLLAEQCQLRYDKRLSLVQPVQDCFSLYQDIGVNVQYANQQSLILSLRNPSVFSHSTEHWQLIETHISWVVLCGDYAYKIKKALDLGFLNFTTLEQRKFYCGEELRLNSRLAPELYLDVVAITGTLEQPQLGGVGKAIEYAVKMKRFSQRELLSEMVSEERLHQSHIDQLVEQIADFHLTIPAASEASAYGRPEQVHAPVKENFSQIRARTDHPQHTEWVAHLEDWAEREYQRLYQQFEWRKQQGFVRECHGDMHLGNIALIDKVPVVFDGIEFNPDLYWIDVISEVAFLFMDLHDHGKRDYAFRFVNGYLELTGDYSGLQLLRYYLAYRATVRAKIAVIRFSQVLESDQQDLARDEFERYLQLAVSYTQPQVPFLLITHGLSGSGKSTLSAPLAERLGAIRIRSDRERQRLLGKGKLPGEATQIDDGVYSADASAQTYTILEALAKQTLESGYSVIVDATFLSRSQRELFRAMADRVGVPLRILYFCTDPAVLRQRIASRQHEGRDISEADISVLEHQLATYTGLDDDEQNETLTINTSLPCSHDKIALQVMESLA